MKKEYLIKKFNTSYKTIYVYKGRNGDSSANVEIDIKVEYDGIGKRTRSPKHLHWVNDMLIKKTNNKKLTIKLINTFIEIYNSNNSFKSIKDMKECKLILPSKKIQTTFNELNKYGEYSVDFLFIIIGLFSKMEKNCENHYMFKNLLTNMISKDNFTLINAASRAY